MAKVTLVLGALLVLCLVLTPAHAQKVAAKKKVVAKGKGEVFFKAKSKVAPRPSCPTPVAGCDFKYGPVVPKVKIVAGDKNVVVLNTTLVTRRNEVVNQASVAACRVYPSNAQCSGFLFLPKNGVPFFDSFNAQGVRFQLNYNTLAVQPLSAPQANAMKNKCIVLTIGDFDVQGVGPINSATGFKEFPVKRRCLVIKT